MFARALAWLGLNKVLLLVAGIGVAAAGGVFLFYRAQVATLEAALASQERDVAVAAAEANAGALEEMRRLARLNADALARFLDEQRQRQADLTSRLQEINNAPLAPSCPADPVLDRTLERVFGPHRAPGAGGAR